MPNPIRSERLPAPDAAQLGALTRGELSDPFALLGPHAEGEGCVIRAFLPGAVSVSLLARDSGETLAAMQRLDAAGLFAARLARPCDYRLRIQWPGTVQDTEDPYAFGLLLGELDLHLFAEGRHCELGQCFGAQALSVDGIAGVRFAVWAPNARRVSVVVGPFNGWDGRRPPMRLRLEAGVWELFLPRLRPGEIYKYEVLGPEGPPCLKADPVARRAELAPGTASIVDEPAALHWTDAAWLSTRGARQAPDAAISIYEVHTGSWQRDDHGRGPPLDYLALADQLAAHAGALGFTHIELMPIMEHPFGGSWGYQPLSLFAPTARHGAPAAFGRFVDACHGANLGVILDWVPAHFPADAHGLRRFDGTALYEHEDPREGYHPDWNTLIYNFGRPEVLGFLVASALHWLEHFHVDGLRVDAVASMLRRDYSRKAGEWLPNVHGGPENLEAVAFLKRLNQTIAERCPGAVVIAEESTAWPGVTHPVAEGGLGFAYKWNMGWMNDTLRYVERDSVHRKHHHADLTFGLMYAFSERFLLPLSHDEVVHLKRSLLLKMPGDDWQRHAGLRAYYGLMWGYPGKKLLFMGGELAQTREWNHDAELEWSLLQQPRHRGAQRLVGDLNRLYAGEPALHQRDCDSRGFRWAVVDDAEHSVFAWLRFGADGAAPVLVVCNLTPVPHAGYRIGVPAGGRWRELLNTDAAIYGGSNLGNLGRLVAEPRPSHGQRDSLLLRLPPLATLFLRHDAA
ncbi:MAG: 1,4-alpha-glucan branching protein GlgB [Nevskia sp.]